MRIPQARLRFDGELLKSLISQAGGVGALLDAWHARFSEAEAALDTPDRSTVYRWMNGGWPRTSNQLLALAHLLEIDPFCFLRITEQPTHLVFKALYICFQLRKWKPPALSFLAFYFGHQRDWPPSFASNAPLARSWFVREILHEHGQERSVYRAIRLTGMQGEFDERPQVFHFAYRHPELFDQQWVEYGFVVRQGPFARLISINGHVQSKTMPAMGAPTMVETWFGPSPTIFRIASLHEFTADLGPVGDDQLSPLRFPV